jgi:hypothetical protein
LHAQNRCIQKVKKKVDLFWKLRILQRFSPQNHCKATLDTVSEEEKPRTQYRPVIRKPDIRKSGYKKGAGRVPAELLFIT